MYNLFHTRKKNSCSIIKFALCFALSSTPIVQAVEAVSPESDAANFASWRGPHGNGTADEGEYPIKWSELENIAWRTELLGRGASTPIMVGDRLFTTTADPKTNYLTCIDADGNVLWSQKAENSAASKHQKATGANPSPVSDGSTVFAYFKSGDVVATDFSGQVLWEKNLQKQYGENTLWWDLGTSPVLTQDALIIAVMQTGPSFLVALDKKTGNEIWKTQRAMDANEESNQAYTTPVVTTFNGQTMLLTFGADHLTAHSDKGVELFRLGGFNPTNHKYFRTIASPVCYDDLAICPYARGDAIAAIRIDPAISADDRIAWRRDDLGVDVPTPIVAEDRVYICGDKGDINCLDAKTGKTIWQDRLPKNRSVYSSSPVLAGGFLYCAREDGHTFVVDINDGFKLLAENILDGQTVSTPVFHDGKIFFQMYDVVVCISSR